MKAKKQTKRLSAQKAKQIKDKVLALLAKNNLRSVGVGSVDRDSSPKTITLYCVIPAQAMRVSQKLPIAVDGVTLMTAVSGKFKAREKTLGKPGTVTQKQASAVKPYAKRWLSRNNVDGSVGLTSDGKGGYAVCVNVRDPDAVRAAGIRSEWKGVKIVVKYDGGQAKARKPKRAVRVVPVDHFMLQQPERGSY